MEFQKSEKEDKEDKINLFTLTKNFKVTDLESFKNYLKEVYVDLYQRMLPNQNKEEKSQTPKGLNKITFIHYYDLPGIMSDRLFSVFDLNKNNYIETN